MVVAEGARPRLGARAVLAPAEIGHAERLGGMGEQVAHELGQRTGKDARVVVLGHLLRGGSPTSFDRLAALRFGTAAVRALEERQRNEVSSESESDRQLVRLTDKPACPRAGRFPGYSCSGTGSKRTFRRTPC